MNKMTFKALGIVVSLLASLLAGAIFKKPWKLAPGSDDAPEATDERRGWGEILLAAGLQGVIFALIKAVFERPPLEACARSPATGPGKRVSRPRPKDSGPVLRRFGPQLTRLDLGCSGVR